MHAPAQLLAAGAYVPRLRLARSTIHQATGWLAAARPAPSGARSVCSWDEDSLTMATEAACSARTAAGAPLDRGAIGALVLASTTLPFADRSNAGIVAAALDLPETAATQDVGGSLRAATTALLQLARGSTTALLLAADARHAKPGSAQELAYGHGAAALLIAPAAATASDSTPAAAALATILGTAQIHADFVDHYRQSGAEFDYALEERWVRDEALATLPARAIAAALRDAQIDASAVKQFAMPGAAASIKRVAASAGLSAAEAAFALDGDCGDTGTAHPLLMLIGALERASPGDLIVLAAFGQGVDALVLRCEAGLRAWQKAAPLGAALARRAAEPQYLRYLAHAGLVEMDFGMRAERDQRTAQSVAWRKRRALSPFIGGQCRLCGAVQFPLSRVCVNPQCRATDSQDEYALAARSGRVKTFTEDWQAYSPRPPYVYGNIEFDVGGNLLMEVADVDAGELQIGDAVRFAFRIKDVDRLRGFRRYFWKAVKA